MPTKSMDRRNIKRSLFINITFFSSTSQSNIPHQFCFTGPYNSPIRQPKHNLNKNNKQQYFKGIKYSSATSSNLISQIKLLPICILGKVRYSRFSEIPSILSGKAIIQVTLTNSETRALSLRKKAAQMKPSTLEFEWERSCHPFPFPVPFPVSKSAWYVGSVSEYAGVGSQGATEALHILLLKTLDTATD